MKWVNRLGYMVVLSTLLFGGLYLENIYLIAISLSLGYLLNSWFLSVFTRTRERLLQDMVEQEGRNPFHSGTILPFSNHEGVFVFQPKKPATTKTVEGYLYTIQELNRHELKAGTVKKHELEIKFFRFLRDSHFLIWFSFLLALGLASYKGWSIQEYNYFWIPGLMFFYHITFYAHLSLGVLSMKWGEHINRNRDELVELMSIYVGTVLEKETAVINLVDVFQSGDILVRFHLDGMDYYHHVSIEDRVRLEVFLDEGGDSFKE